MIYFQKNAGGQNMAYANTAKIVNLKSRKWLRATQANLILDIPPKKNNLRYALESKNK